MKMHMTFLALVLTAMVATAADVKWEKQYVKVLEQSKKDKKLVMVDVFTEWCGWCKKLDKDVYSNKEVAEALAKNFVAIKLNPEESTKNKKVAAKFQVNGFPTIIFLDSNGKELSKIGGYVPADEFLKRLNEVVNKAK